MRKKRANASIRRTFQEMRTATEQAQEQMPTDFLNYPGNHPDLAGQLVGPDRFGARYRIITADYDSETDRTRAGLRVEYRPGVGGRVRA